VSVRTPVYLDHAATTPLDPRVLDRVTSVLRDHFGNPASETHAFGWTAASLLAEARERVAELVGGTPREIVFTSGATESINLALRGVAERYGGRGDHMVTTNLEHPAVDETLAALAGRGWRITRVAAGPEGRIDPDDVAAALTPQTVLVSLTGAQNEIGTLQPVREVGALCRERGVLLHVDGAQAAGKVALDVGRDAIDLLSLSAHKFYGPKGAGALYVRRRDPRVSLAPLVTGGGQERGLRGGTPDVAAIVGMGVACRLAREEMAREAGRLRGLERELLARLQAGLDGVQLNGAGAERLPGHLNLSFAGIMAHRLLAALPVLACSSSSACSSGSTEPSPILARLGVSPQLARASLRLVLGRGTTPEEVAFAAERIVQAVSRLRRENPLGRPAPPAARSGSP
jgi:cysteine desulfurase